MAFESWKLCFSINSGPSANEMIERLCQGMRSSLRVRQKKDGRTGGSKNVDCDILVPVLAAQVNN